MKLIFESTIKIKYSKCIWKKNAVMPIYTFIQSVLFTVLNIKFDESGFCCFFAKMDLMMV